MKKIVLLFVATLGFSSLSYSQNCKNYKNGKFKLQDDELGVTYIIERKGNLQTERKLGEDTVLDFEVIWIDDCTYTLKSSEKTEAFLKSNVDLIVKIKDISGDFLELEMHMKDYPQSKISTIVEVIN